MKNSRLILLVAVLAGLGFAIYLGNKNSGSTIKKQLSNFAVDDTASITKVFLSDKNNQSLLIERTENGRWKLNGEQYARPDVVNNLLKTIKEVTVRAPVSKSMFENVVKQLASKSVKVEIYLNGENTPHKVYYVGDSNMDHTGTFMLLENSSVPFAMHIEGHYGFLQTRYSTNVNDWRDNSIWSFPGKSITSIASIKVEHPQEPNASFEIRKKDETHYELFDVNNQAIQMEAPGVLYEYIKRYKQISYEGFEETKSKAYCDSIVAHSPVQQIISLKEENGTTTTIKTFVKPAKEGSTDLQGNPILSDLERLYAVVNDKDFVIIQYFVFDPLTLKKSDLLAP